MEREVPTRQFEIRWTSPVLLSCLLTLGMAEALLRVERMRSVLPRPIPYYDAGVETRLRVLEAVQARHGRIDVLFLGSSVVETNIRPLLFDRVVAERTGRPLVSFNGGLSALHPDPVRLYAEHFWLDRVSPRVVVQGVRYEEVRSGLLASEWYRFRSGRFERIWLSESPLARLQRALISNVQLLYYQGAWTDVLTAPWFRVNRRRHVPVDERGWSPRRLLLEEAIAGGRLPATPPRHSGDVRTEDFRTGLQALARTAALVRRRGADYILINVPEHCGKFAAPADELYETYLDRLAGFARSHGIPLIDVTAGDPGAYCEAAWFSDYHHMTPVGAAVFTRALGRQVAPYLPTPVTRRSAP